MLEGERGYGICSLLHLFCQQTKGVLKGNKSNKSKIMMDMSCYYVDVASIVAFLEMVTDSLWTTISTLQRPVLYN